MKGGCKTVTVARLVCCAVDTGLQFQLCIKSLLFAEASDPAEPLLSCMENGKQVMTCGLYNSFKASRPAHAHSKGLIRIYSYGDTQRVDSGPSLTQPGRVASPDSDPSGKGFYRTVGAGWHFLNLGHWPGSRVGSL